MRIVSEWKKTSISTMLACALVVYGISYPFREFLWTIASYLGGYIISLVMFTAAILALYFILDVYVLNRCPKGGAHNYDHHYGASKFYKGSGIICIKCGKDL